MKTILIIQAIIIIVLLVPAIWAIKIRIQAWKLDKELQKHWKDESKKLNRKK